MNIKELSQKYGANLDFVKREFKWWCRSRGVDPKDFLRWNGLWREYQLPKEFVEYFDKVFRRDMAKRKVIRLEP